MRTVALIAMFAALAGVFCSGKSTIMPARGARWQKKSLGTLTEADITEFVRLLPRLNGALKAAGWKVAPSKPGEGVAGFLDHFVAGLNVPGTDESLKAAGSSWSRMRSLMYRVFPAVNAARIDAETPAILEQLSKDTSAAGRKGLKEYEGSMATSAQIPKVNKELVNKHLQELLAITKLGT